VEILALAVRGASTTDEGMYCRVVYGGKHLRTMPLSKGDAADWKEHIVVSTYAPGDLIIECCRKKLSEPFSKFLGRVIITEKELNDTAEGTIRAWFSLTGRGKKKETISGRMFVSLIIPGRQQQSINTLQSAITVNNVTSEPQKTTVRPLPVPKFTTIVVDRLTELRPELKKHVVVHDETIPDEFLQKTESIEKTVRTIDDQLKSLEFKLRMFQRRGTNLFLKQEIERITKEVEDILDLASKRLRQMGAELNSVNDQDLSTKMKSFNDVLDKLMSRTDEFHKLSEDVNRAGILT